MEFMREKEKHILDRLGEKLPKKIALLREL